MLVHSGIEIVGGRKCARDELKGFTLGGGGVGGVMSFAKSLPKPLLV